MLKKLLLLPLLLIVVATVGLNLWGLSHQGTHEPGSDANINPDANRVVMVFGATGSVGDSLLKTAMADPQVEEVHVVTRRTSPRIDAGVASGRITLHMHSDFTDYTALEQVLRKTNTVMWGLGTTSIGMDDDTYTRIHVDFPMAFIRDWLTYAQTVPRSFHFVTGMGTDPEGDQHWAREKGRTEREMTRYAVGNQLRTFSYRSGFIQPASETINAGHSLLMWLLRPGHLAVTGEDLGASMLEISARVNELPNGSLIDNADTVAYAQAYHQRMNTP